MRVTGQQSHQNRLREMMQGQERLEAARDRVSTGYKINRPSDSPGDISELLRTRSRMAELTRRRDGIDSRMPEMKAGESALGDITAGLREARTLTLQAQNATTSPEQRTVLAAQLSRVRERLTHLANTQVGGAYLFAGTDVDAPPFDPAAPGGYAGNNTPLQIETPDGAPFQASITGEALRNVQGGQDMFQALQSLENAVRTGDTAGISAGLARLDGDLQNTISLRADLGQRLQYAEWSRNRLDDDVLTQEERRAQLQDVDLAEAITDVARLEQAQQATLAMTARLGRPSLLDYLG